LALWNLDARTVAAKLVYYGPAQGGKTTNLVRLHGLTDPEGRAPLVSVDTADDRTLFFDLLSIDLGRLLGLAVGMKLYTVPGQVRYEATRRIVLAGADAVVFVADSAAGREHDNRRAWDDLRANMRANGLDPAGVPVLVQLNKRDLAGATPVDTVAGWLGVPADRILPATATQGEGVVETFAAASQALLSRLVAQAEPATRRGIAPDELSAELARALLPLRARADAGCGTGDRRDGQAIVVRGDDPELGAVAGSVELASRLAEAQTRAARHEREAEALRRLSDGLRAATAAFERATVIDAVLDAIVAVDPVSVAAVLSREGRAGWRVERSAGPTARSLLRSRSLKPLLAWMIGGTGPYASMDLTGARGPDPGTAPGSAAAAEVDRERRAFLVVAAPGAAWTTGETERRFLATVAGHLSVGLEKVRAHAELAAHRDRLEEAVRARTSALRAACRELTVAEAAKDRFLSGVSHEMRTPLTAIIGAASYLRDYDGDAAQRREMAATVLAAADALEEKVAAVLRVAQLAGASAPVPEPMSAEALVTGALRLAGGAGSARVVIDAAAATLFGDGARLARALANLIDNARKFGPPGAPIEVRVAPADPGPEADGHAGVALSVLDAGPGLPQGDLARAFEAFEQGGDVLTAKPRGIGLGLFEARAIVRRHGGTLVYRPRPGGGSEFRLVVPAQAAGAPLDEAVHA